MFMIQPLLGEAKSLILLLDFGCGGSQPTLFFVILKINSDLEILGSTVIPARHSLSA